MGVPEHRGRASLTLGSCAQLLAGRSDLSPRLVDQGLPVEFKETDDYPGRRDDGTDGGVGGKQGGARQEEGEVGGGRWGCGEDGEG